MPEPLKKTRIGVTGAKGLIGWHLRAYLHGKPEIETVPSDRAAFASDEALEEFVSRCDAIVHLAGMNRGADDEIEKTNVDLVARLIRALERSNSAAHVVFASSAHIDRDTAYARSKRKATELLEAWAARSGGRATILVLPHVFGESGKPFYNSVVSTFCHQLAAGDKPEIKVDGALELLHAQRVAEMALDAILSGQTGRLAPAGAKMKVSALLVKLRGLADSYRGMVVPDLRQPIDLDLFNTYRSYLFPRHYPVSPPLRTDPRGELFEAVKTLNGGQSFISTTKPGITRGNHYHRRKVERFLVVQGKAVIRLRRLFSDEVVEYAVDGAAPQYIDMPTLHTHSITNTGPGELVTLFWSHEIFDPMAPDTYAEKVQE